MNTFKRIGRFNKSSAYEKEFGKHLLRIPNMAQAEQFFDYCKDLKTEFELK